MDSIQSLSKDLREAAKLLGRSEARFLVDLYYTTQDNRIRANNQIRACGDEEPNLMLSWVARNFTVTENGCKSALNVYAKNQRVGRWLLGVHGIGPCIAAGMLAHIDIEKAPTVGHIWRFAGLDPTVKWIGKKKAEKLVKDTTGKGKLTEEMVSECAEHTPFKPEQVLAWARNEAGTLRRDLLTKALSKRPWNNGLKVLCWKLGKSFVMLRGSGNDEYGYLYDQRKAYETGKNEAGDYADQAAAALAEKNYSKDTDAKKAYLAGRLPLAQIDARARRWTVKLFLAHLHHVMYEDRYNEPPPKPYVMSHLGHAHEIKAQGWPCE